MMRLVLTLLLTATLCSISSPVWAQSAAPAPQRNPFDLTPVEQAYLNQVLEKWELESAKIQTFSCPFVRREYNAFSPNYQTAFSVEEGEVSYQQPDKGSFQIKTISRWQAEPRAPGDRGPAKGKHVLQPSAVGEHWVCDGKSIYEYKHEQKQLVVRPIPPDMQGKSIVDGPLPFLFGAEADKLKKRYWMRVERSQDPNIIHLVAQPKFQADAANYKAVELMLDRNRFLPAAMQVHQPDSSRSVYVFEIAKSTVNSRVTQLWNALFQSPRTPRGWTRIVDTPPTAQAAGESAVRR